MTPIELLREYIKGAHPQATVTLACPLSEDGVWSMDLVCGDKRLAVEWSRVTGFGVSSLSDESYGERPDEAFKSLNDVQRRITELLTTNERTVPPLGVLLSRLRELRGNTQEELASKLEVRQATVSGMERRGDIQFSTLRRVIEALSGSLEIYAVFSEAKYRIWPDLVNCTVDAQSRTTDHEHSNISPHERREAVRFDYEANFGALFACGKLSLARKVGHDISSRGMVLEMGL
jgi:transcriptional regulator with XRE-family HTH domain